MLEGPVHHFYYTIGITQQLSATSDQWCGFKLSCVPAGKVESIPSTLAGLVHVSLVFQQLYHTLSMRRRNYLIW